jgi:hypothetical protein
MQADFSLLKVGERYSRDDLTRLWGLKGRQALSRGIVTPAKSNLIILFVTQRKPGGMTQYVDRLEGVLLEWEGDGVSHNLRRIAGQLANPTDEIHLLFRDEINEAFLYCGDLELQSADLSHPNGRFRFRLDEASAATVSANRRVTAPTTPSTPQKTPPSVAADNAPMPPATSVATHPRDSGTASRQSAWGWAGSVVDFLAEQVDSIESRLADHYRQLNFEEPAASHLTAWRESLRFTKTAMQSITAADPSALSWHLIFEYELPRERGRRPDMVVLAGGTIVVVEFKGYSDILSAHVDQCAGYARDLADYHEASHDHPVMAVLCLTSRKEQPLSVRDVTAVSGSDLALGIQMAIAACRTTEAIDPQTWLAAEYAPLPSLVSAARMIFEHERLPHIRRAESAGIPETLAVLDRVADTARDAEESHLVLITGVPGAGKTLVGLQFVYESHFGEPETEQHAVFLSGNGPLVKVLQHTLKSRVFVQDVLGFLRSYGGSQGALPREHIWVFDEAQRAFDAEMAREKRGEPISEPEDFLRLGERLDSWALMVGLIGEGQEINRGEEAGIAQWNDALGLMHKPWKVHCPSTLAHVFTHASETFIEDRLNLDVTLRSHRAEQTHRWVALLLDGQLAECKDLSVQLLGQGFELYVTRDIEAAKTYARERYAGEIDARYGLLASSKARNLMGYGFANEFQFTQNMRVGPWFADPPDSPQSCCSFRDTATEFQCQGLELDMPIVGWGHDLWWTGTHWDCSTRYKVKNPRQLRLNAYRVLLTRGRDGFIAFVPPEPKYTPVFDALVSAGCVSLSRVWLGT